MSEPQIEEPGKQPIFNLPNVILLLGLSFILVHLVRTYLLSAEEERWAIAAFSFIPASFGPLFERMPVPNSWMWSSVSYSFLHGDWTHLIINLVWMAAFGAPVAARFGVFRFLILTVLTSIGGAFFHYLFHINQLVPVIGASGAVSGFMGAAARFAFSDNGYGKGFNNYGPALSLVDSFKNRRFLTFLLVWMIVNFAFGTGYSFAGLGESGIAWQAHMGGFLVGLLAFSFLDPVKK